MLIAKTRSIARNFPATPQQLWKVLTDPEDIKSYLYGTTCQTTWEPQTPIVFSGNYEGTVYEDHGIVLEFTPHERIVYTYWTSFAGLPDIPENYGRVSYTLQPVDGGTQLTITQEGFTSEEAYEHMESSWGSVADLMAKCL